MRFTGYAHENPVRLKGAQAVDRYGDEVAAAYEAAPSFEADEVWRWELLIAHIERMFERMQRGRTSVRVEFVDGQPYDSAEDLQRGVRGTGTLYVSRDFNTHPLFTPLQNLKFRAVHDYMSHIARSVDFGMRGEILAYNTHAKTVPPDALSALFTEVVGQAAMFLYRGYFPEQKIALLPFDYYNVGVTA